MISRQWRGLARSEQAESYIEHLQKETFPGIRRIPGFVSATIHRRSLPGGIEFLIVTQWASIEAIRAFAGADLEKAVVPREVREVMIEYDRVVRHYEVVN